MMKKTICIDYGHCKTAATLAMSEYFLNKENIPELRPMVYDLHVNCADLVTSTEMGLTYEQIDKLSERLRPDYDSLAALGDIPIGNMIPNMEGKGEVFRSFVVPPKKFNTLYKDSVYAKSKNLTYGALMACYMYALIEKIFELNEDRLGEESRDSIDIVVGCPILSDRTDDPDRSKLEKLLKNAVGVSSVKVIPESQAAMYNFIRNNKLSARDGVLILDFGSSTADCTYMLPGKAKFDFSWALGAGKIEQLINEDVKKGIPDYQNFEFDPCVDSETEKSFRKAKESYYLGRSQKMIGIYKNLKTQDEEVSVVKFDDALMTRIVNDTEFSISIAEKGLLTGSWAGLCNEFMCYAKESISGIMYSYTSEEGYTNIVSCPVTKVFLTGGASRMGFIEDIAKSVFPDTEVIFDYSPFKNISSGLGWAACSESVMEECIEKAKNKFIMDNRANIQQLINLCETDICKFIYDEVMKRLNSWADNPNDFRTPNMVQNDIDKFTSSDALRSFMYDITVNHLEQWGKQNAYCLNFYVYREIPEIFTKSFDSSPIVTDNILDYKMLGGLNFGTVTADIGIFFRLTRLIMNLQHNNVFKMPVRRRKQIIELNKDEFNNDLKRSVSHEFGKTIELYINDVIENRVSDLAGILLLKRFDINA